MIKVEVSNIFIEQLCGHGERFEGTYLIEQGIPKGARLAAVDCRHDTTVFYFDDNEKSIETIEVKVQKLENKGARYGQSKNG